MPTRDRYELDDHQWSLIEENFPKTSRGRPWRDHRQVFNGILWILFSGACWRDLPERYGPWQTAHRRLCRWRADRTWDRILRKLRLRADRKGLLDWAQWNVDSTSIRATRAAAGEKSGIDNEPIDHALGLSHGGFGTKLHLATDGRGLPLGFVLTPGNRNECPTFEPLMSITRQCRSRCRWPRKLAADKGYSSDRLRLWLKHRRIDGVIPMRANEHVHDRNCFGRFDKRAYRNRNVVERCVGWLKNCRRICTRYEKLAVNFEAMVKLAMIAMYLRQPL